MEAKLKIFSIMIQSVDKLDYMERLFAALHAKRTELYVITGIWHRLKRTDVKFVIQQPIILPTDKYAYGDLYLPQLNLWIEINEPPHKNQKEADDKRNAEIKEITNGEQYIIYGYNPKDNSVYDIDDLNYQIDKIVAYIRLKIAKLGENFIPWDDNYAIRKKYLCIKEYLTFKTIDQIARIFNAPLRRRGFLKPGGFALKGGYIVWAPNTKNTKWKNILSKTEDEIIEYKIDKATGGVDRVDTPTGFDTAEKRIVFCKYKDYLGNKDYKYIGVFVFKEFDTNGARKWVKESDCIDITNLIY